VLAGLLPCFVPPRNTVHEFVTSRLHMCINKGSGQEFVLCCALAIACMREREPIGLLGLSEEHTHTTYGA
jgi:hypothetical protein